MVSSDPGLQLKCIHRADGDADVYFVANLAPKNGAADCAFGVTGRQPELWDPVSGERRDSPEYQLSAGKTIVPLQFAASQSWFVVFRKPVSSGGRFSGVKHFPETKIVGDLDDAWRVQFDPKWGGPAQPVEFATLEDWTNRPEIGIKYYSGTAVYEKNFDLPDTVSASPGVRLFLDLGTVRDIAEMSLNGHDLGVVWTVPWRVDITSAVKAKGNRLQIKVTNCWANRQIGDEQLPADCVFCQRRPGLRRAAEGIPRMAGQRPAPPIGTFHLRNMELFQQTFAAGAERIIGAGYVPKTMNNFASLVKCPPHLEVSIKSCREQNLKHLKNETTIHQII